MLSLREHLKDMTITGIHCSACDFLIEVLGEPITNDDYFDAAEMHHNRFHHNDPPDERTSYDIRAVRQLVVQRPVTQVDIKLER